MRLASGLLLLILFLPAGAPAADPSPSALLQGIYRNHQPWRHKEISLSDPAVLGRYFTDSLVVLFVKEEACKREHPGELCCLDSDPLYDAQDLGDAEDGIQNLHIRRLSETPAVTYEVTFDSHGRAQPWKRRLLYTLTKTKSGWRIDDIQYPAGTSLRKQLSCPVVPPRP